MQSHSRLAHIIASLEQARNGLAQLIRNAVPARDVTAPGIYDQRQAIGAIAPEISSP